MATSKAYKGLVPTLSTDYTDFLTLETGVEVTVFRLEQIDRNIFAITIAGNVTTPIPAHSKRAIATYNLTKLPPLTAHVPGFLNINNVYYPQNIFFNATGAIEIYNLSDTNSSAFSANGLMYRRLS